MSNKFFPQRPEANPTIYVYELIGVPTHIGLLKVGYTVRASEKGLMNKLKQQELNTKFFLKNLR